MARVNSKRKICLLLELMAYPSGLSFPPNQVVGRSAGSCEEETATLDVTERFSFFAMRAVWGLLNAPLEELGSTRKLTPHRLHQSAFSRVWK